MIKGNYKKNIKNQKVEIIIYIISIIAFLFMPSSKNGISITNFTVSIYIMCIFMLIGVLIKGRIDKKNILIWSVIITILILYSIKMMSITSILGMRLGVILQHITFFLLSISIFPKIRFEKIYYGLFIIVNILMVIWGLGLLFSIDPIIKLTFDNYLWGNQGVTIFMINSNKPILSFGVHSIAAFFICQMYFLNYITYKKYDRSFKVIHLFFMIIFFILCVFLKCTTSILLALLMMIFMLKLSKNILTKVPIIISMFVLLFLLYNNKELYNDYTNKLMGFGGMGGISARYSSDLFSEQLNYIKMHGFIGFSDIGFTYTTDSGYILNYMRGGILNVILIITTMIRFFFNNMNKKYAIYASCMMLVFDGITTMFMYPQIAAFIIFSVIYIKMIDTGVSINI